MAYMNGKRTVRCRNCWEKGHNARACPKLTPEQKALYTTGARARKCSYCGEAAHNKAGCERRRGDRAAYIVTNAQYRQRVLDTLRFTGLGIGALITPANLEPSAQSLFMVTEIDWSEVQQKRKYHRIIKAQHLSDPSLYNHFAVPDEVDDWSWSRALIISPVKNPDTIVPPENWLNGESGVENIFR